MLILTIKLKLLRKILDAETLTLLQMKVAVLTKLKVPLLFKTNSLPKLGMPTQFKLQIRKLSAIAKAVVNLTT